jgi:hypothetical protein
MTDKFCLKQRQYFSCHMDGQKIPFFRRLLVRFHLAYCPQCKRTLASLDATRDALRALRDD